MHRVLSKKGEKMRKKNATTDEWMRMKSRCREDRTGLDWTGLPLQELHSHDNDNDRKNWLVGEMGG